MLKDQLSVTRARCRGQVRVVLPLEFLYSFSGRVSPAAGFVLNRSHRTTRLKTMVFKSVGSSLTAVESKHRRPSVSSQ